MTSRRTDWRNLFNIDIKLQKRKEEVKNQKRKNRQFIPKLIWLIITKEKKRKEKKRKLRFVPSSATWVPKISNFSEIESKRKLLSLLFVVRALAPQTKSNQICLWVVSQHQKAAICGRNSTRMAARRSVPLIAMRSTRFVCCDPQNPDLFLSFFFQI